MGRKRFAHKYEDNPEVFHEYLKYLKRPSGKDLEEKVKEAKKLSDVITNIDLILNKKHRSPLAKTKLDKELIKLDNLCDGKLWTRFLNARNKQEKSREFKKNKKVVGSIKLQNEKTEKRRQGLQEKLLKDDPDFARNLVGAFDKFLAEHTELPIKNGEDLIYLLSAIFHDLNPDNDAYLRMEFEISDKETVNNWLRKMDVLFLEAGSSAK